MAIPRLGPGAGRRQRRRAARPVARPADVRGRQARRPRAHGPPAAHALTPSTTPGRARLAGGSGRPRRPGPVRRPLDPVEAQPPGPVARGPRRDTRASRCRRVPPPPSSAPGPTSSGTVRSRGGTAAPAWTHGPSGWSATAHETRIGLARPCPARVQEPVAVEASPDEGPFERVPVVRRSRTSAAPGGTAASPPRAAGRGPAPQGAPSARRAGRPRSTSRRALPRAGRGRRTGTRCHPRPRTGAGRSRTARAA